MVCPTIAIPKPRDVEVHVRPRRRRGYSPAASGTCESALGPGHHHPAAGASDPGRCISDRKDYKSFVSLSLGISDSYAWTRTVDSQPGGAGASDRRWGCGIPAQNYGPYSLRAPCGSIAWSWGWEDHGAGPDRTRPRRRRLQIGPFNSPLLVLARQAPQVHWRRKDGFGRFTPNEAALLSGRSGGIG